MSDFSTGEVAEQFGVTSATVINWIQSGYLKARKKGPGKTSPYRISQVQLEEFLKNHPEVTPIAGAK